MITTQALDAAHATALAQLARVLLECSDAEAVAHVAAATVAEAIGSRRVAVVGIDEDGSVRVDAAVGITAEGRALLEQRARIPASVITSAVPGRHRLFEHLEVEMAGEARDLGRFQIFPVPGEPGLANSITIVAVDMDDVGPGSESFVEAAVDLLAVAHARQRLLGDLRDSEARWRGLVEESPDGMAELDSGGRVVLANPAFSRLTGLSEDSVPGMQLQDVLTVTASGLSGELETKLAGGDAERVLELRLTPIGDRSLATLRDITAARRHARREQALSETARQSESSPGLLFARLVRAVEDERARMASEIHDGPVQRLSGLTLRLETVRDLLAAGRREQAGQVLDAIRHQLTDEVASLRRFMVDLRPPALDRLGLRDAIAQQGRRFEVETGIAFRLTGRGTGRLAAARELVIYRIVQEALLNAAKHSAASTVSVGLDVESANRGTVEIHDDGIGFDPDSVSGRLVGHLGLISMRERAEMVGAEFELRSGSGEGTRIRIRFAARAQTLDQHAGAMVS